MEQREIVARITAAFVTIDASEKSVAEQLAAVAELDCATLSRAFRGELVPQDPSDEPAAVMVERIRAERAAGDGAAKKSGRHTKKNA